jgi:hypothetical protein
VVLQAKGRFVNRPTQTGGKKYDKFFVYIPTDLVKDSQFPFAPGDELVVTLRKGTVELSRAAQRHD